MADILSQEEIDALLEVVEEEDIAPDELDKASDILDNRQITLYDFKRPNRVSKEQLRSIRAIHDKMARSLASDISSLMRRTSSFFHNFSLYPPLGKQKLFVVFTSITISSFFMLCLE